MAEITGTDLGRRVVEPRTGDEIDRLARTLNGTLDRLEASVRRQQRFVADASHELRGPLTRIRAELEVDLDRPDRADLVATHRSVLEETVALQHLVDDLLKLARSDAGARPAERSLVDLDDVVFREARRLKERLDDEGRVRVDTSRVSAAAVMGARADLGRAVRNLLDNAARHAARSVTITLEETSGVVRLGVSDDGAGVPVDQRERIFERFARADDARTPGDGGTGLGLAITREIVEQHGGAIRVDDSRPSCFVVDLPSPP